MARLISPQGASVEASDASVAQLLRMGFKRPQAKEPAKKAASAPKKTSNK